LDDGYRRDGGNASAACLEPTLARTTKGSNNKNNKGLEQQKSRLEGRLFSYRRVAAPMKNGRLALTRLEARILLVNQIDAAFALDDLAVLVARLGGAQRIPDFHGRFLKDLNG
jgi:hypothetical protein